MADPEHSTRAPHPLDATWDAEAVPGILDAISEAVYIQDREGRFLYVNEGAARMYGLRREELIGESPARVTAPGRNDLESVARQVSDAFGGKPQTFPFWALRANGEPFLKEVRLYPGSYRGQRAVIAVAQDISDRHRAEQVREAAYRITEATLTAPDLEQLFREVHAIVRNLMPADNFYIALHDRRTGRVSFPYWVDQMEPVQPERPFGDGLTEFLLRTGRPQLVDAERLRQLRSSGEVDRVGPEGLAWLGVPLSGSHGVFGALVVQSYEGGHRYGEAEQALLTFVSGQVAMAIERKRAETSHRLTKAALDQAQESVFGMESDGRFIFVNQAACEGLGYSRDDLLAMKVMDVDPSVTAEAWVQIWQAGGRGEGLHLETVQRRKDGTFRPVEVSRSFFSFEGRRLLFAHVRDISERRRAEEALRLSEAKFSSAFHASPDAINITRVEDGTYLDVSEGFTRMTGWTRGEAVGKSALDLGIWADPEDRLRMLTLLGQGQGEFIGFEAPFRSKDGHVIQGLMSGKRMEINGEPCLLTFTRDITERKQAEAALRASEQRLWAVLRNAQAVIFQLDSEGRFLLSEGLGLASLGLEPGQVVGLSALELYGEEPELVQQIREALAGRGSRSLTRAAGRAWDNTLTPVRDAQGRVKSVIGIALDVTAQQEAQQALEAERGLFVGGPVMVIRWRNDAARTVDYVSPNVESLLGYTAEDLTSGRVVFRSLVHPEDDSRIREEARRHHGRGTTHYEQEYRIRHADGTYRWFFDFTGAAGSLAETPYFLGYLLDITERRHAEEALRQAQKLESLGVLAGGIAHDFNNLLTSILGNLNLAQLQMPQGAPVQAYLENMEKGILRAAELTKQMLAYSGRGRFVVEAHDLNAVVRELTHLLEVSISKKVALTFDLDPALPPIEADAAQIQQVVMNLVTNASDAIGDRDGRIRICTGRVDLQGEDLPALPGQSLAPGPYAMLEVEDTGCGMAPEVLERIFDPFFTTKATGRGLGLSAMLGILRGHRAGLRIQSRPGEGSVFRLYFPVLATPHAEPAPPAEPAPKARLRGRVLLVDDEEMILETTGAVLSAMGFEVATARDGAEALALVDGDPAGFDLVLMDLTMPRMDGREAFQALRQRDRAAKVILCSGFTEQDILRTFDGEAPSAFIQKPYQVQELRRVIQRILEGGRG